MEMGIMLLFVLLFPSMHKSYGIPYTSKVYRNQTWDEAANDSTCSMEGLNLTGEVEENIGNVTSSITLGKYQIAWIGAYARRVWINFEGCQYGILKSNHNRMTLTSQGDPAGSCLRYCNYSRFVLAEDTCVCYKDDAGFNYRCLAKQCINTKYRYCGKGTAVISNITYHCMCRFSMENNPSSITNEGNCLSVSYSTQRQLIATNCSYTYRPICYDAYSNQADISGSSNYWLQSISECYDKNTQFASKSTTVTGIPDGIYCVGTFAVTYKLWGRSRTDNDSCVAVSIDRTNNHLTTVVLPCDTLLPALCKNKSISNNRTEVSTECSSPCKPHSLTHTQQYDTATTVPSTLLTTPPSQRTPTNSSEEYDDQTTDILSGGTQKHQVTIIVGSVVGSVVCVAIFAAVVLFLWRGRAFRKRSTETDNGFSNVEDRIATSIIYRETNPGTIGVSLRENFYENSGAETPEGDEYIEPLGSARLDTTGSGVYINGAVMSQPEELTEQNPESDYCGLRLPSHDEHEYGTLE